MHATQMRRLRRWRWTRIFQVLGVAVLIVGLAACGTSAQGPGQTAANASPTSKLPATSSTAQASPTTSPSNASPTMNASPTASASPMTGTVPGAVPVGAQGNDAWALTASRFLLTTDQGAHWASTALPVGFTGNGTAAAMVSPDGALWLLSAAGSTASIYHAAGPDSPWTKISINLIWPAPTQTQGSYQYVPPGVDFAAFGSSAPGIVTAVVTEGNTGLAGLVLVSTDGGKTFAQHDPPMLYGDWHPAFISATTGVIVGSGVSSGGATPTPELDAIYSTTDGGASWQPVALPGYSEPKVSLLGTPLVVGSHTYVTANTPTVNGRSLALYVSDNGQSFTLQGTVAVPEVNTNAAPLLGVNGSSVWMLTGSPSGTSSIYESTNSGVGWTATLTSALKPAFATLAISLNSSSSAMIWLQVSSCTAYKTNCASSEELLATADGGHQWQQVSVPTQ